MKIEEVEFCHCYLGIKEKKGKIIEYKNLPKGRYFFRVKDKFYDCTTFKLCPLSSSEAGFGEEYITQISKLDEAKLESDFLKVLNSKKQELLEFIGVNQKVLDLAEEVVESLPPIEIYDYCFGTVVDERKPIVEQIGVAVAVLFNGFYIDIMTGKKINVSLDGLKVGDVIGYDLKVIDFHKLDMARRKMLMLRASQAINLASEEPDSCENEPIVARKM